MHALTAQARARFRTEGHSREVGRFVPQAPQGWVMDTKPTNEVPRIGGLVPRNYGARPSRSTVKLGEKRL